MLNHGKSFQCKLEISEKMSAITSFAGLGFLRECIKKLGLVTMMKSFGLKQEGYADEVVLEALILLLASGGRSLSDWEYLKSESGFERMYGGCPSVDTLERYLRRLEVRALEAHPRDLPENEGECGYTKLLERLHQLIILSAHRLAGFPQELTLDIDTNIIETAKDEALYSYEKTKAYQPIKVYCPELSMVLAHEFRDGNLSPQLGYKRLVKRCEELLPGVIFTLRSDAAGYQNEFLDWLQKRGHHYVITARQPKAMDAHLLRVRRWQPLVIDHVQTGQEVAELIHCPAFSSQEQLHIRMRKRRYIAIRKPIIQRDLFQSATHTHQVIVTDDLTAGYETVIKRHRGRCGSVEYAHNQMNQCGMDVMPSGDFGVNAAWYSLGCLTHNLLRLMQNHLLPEELKRCEIQTLRFRFIRTAALLIKKARGLIMRFCRNHPAYELYRHGRLRLAECVG